MSFDAGKIVGRLVLDRQGFTSGMLGAQGMVQAFGPMVSQFMTNPILGAVQAMKKIVSLTREQQDAELRLKAALNATGHAAGFNIDQMKEMADAYSKITGKGDEEILKAMSVMSTFKKVTGDTFKEAIEHSANLSGQFGGDMAQKAMQLGKALNDPLKGIRALRDSGVDFTAQQQAMIKSMVQAGDLAGAQAIIMQELRGQVAGTAEAMGGEMGGSLDRLQNSVGDLAQQFGEVLAPAISDIAEGLSELLDTLGPVVELIGYLVSPSKIIDAGADALGYGKPIEEARKERRAQQVAEAREKIGAQKAAKAKADKPHWREGPFVTVEPALVAATARRIDQQTRRARDDALSIMSRLEAERTFALR